MQRMHGNVEVDSRPGEGSTFWLEFEAADQMVQTIPDTLREQGVFS